MTIIQKVVPMKFLFLSFVFYLHPYLISMFFLFLRFKGAFNLMVYAQEYKMFMMILSILEFNRIFFLLWAFMGLRFACTRVNTRVYMSTNNVYFSVVHPENKPFHSCSSKLRNVIFLQSSRCTRSASIPLWLCQLLQQQPDACIPAWFVLFFQLAPAGGN
jgi:hypothetical protein